jgi:hypothetical protein
MQIAPSRHRTTAVAKMKTKKGKKRVMNDEWKKKKKKNLQMVPGSKHPLMLITETSICVI